MSFSCDFYYGATPRGKPNPNYGRILMTVAGADGSIAPEEWAVLEGIAEILHIPPQAIEDDRDFDWKNAKLEDLVDSRGGETAKVALVYDMIRVAGGDMNYGAKERGKVEKAAKLLGVDQKLVDQLEEIVSQEDALRRRKRDLIFPGGRRG
jgi:uncharacterized tellurite resistance protein B-like protein